MNFRPPFMGTRKKPRPVPCIFSANDIHRLVQASKLGRRNPFRGLTYGTFFSLLACTGLRVSEAIRLRFEDVTSDGLIIRCSNFERAAWCRCIAPRSEAEWYHQKRRPSASFEDHVFVSLPRHALLVGDAETAFRTAAQEIGLKREPGLPRPTIHTLRHTFAVRSLATCPDSRDRITKHMMALSTYLEHREIPDTYWCLEATPELMSGIAAGAVLLCRSAGMNPSRPTSQLFCNNACRLSGRVRIHATPMRTRSNSCSSTPASA